eukprot:1722696-Prymnesium_polylepis.1
MPFPQPHRTPQASTLRALSQPSKAVPPPYALTTSHPETSRTLTKSGQLPEWLTPPLANKLQKILGKIILGNLAVRTWAFTCVLWVEMLEKIHS